MVVEFVTDVVAEAETVDVNVPAVFVTEAAESVIVLSFAVVQILSALQVAALVFPQMVVEFVVAVVAEAATEDVSVSAVFVTEADESVMVVVVAAIQILSVLQASAPVLLLVVKFVIVAAAEVETETEDMKVSAAFAPAAAELVMVAVLSGLQMLSILQVSPTCFLQ